MGSPAVLTVTLNPAIDLHLEIGDWRPSEVVRARRAVRVAGGKALNVARMLATCGVAATAAVALGGPDAEVYRGLLDGAPFEWVVLPAPGAVRTNVTVADRRGRRRMKVNQAGPRWDRAAWVVARARLTGLIRGRAAVAIGGSRPPGLPAGAEAWVVREAHRAGALAAVDAAGPALVRVLAARPDVVHLNRRELAETLGRPAATLRTQAAALAAARRLTARGARYVLLSSGGGPALMVTAREAWRASPPRVRARGAVGAGDAMLAGCVARLLADDSAAEALRWAVACGAAAAAARELTHPTRAAMRRHLRAVRVTPM